MEIEINVPDGQSGEWSVKTFTVSKNDAMISSFRDGGRSVSEGTYKSLNNKYGVIMSNTPAEIRDHWRFIKEARGHVLINGLGLGVCLKAILEKEEVTKVTVIEKSEDVIKLVAPTYECDRLEIINADAFDYKPPKGVIYDVVWHDIWQNISSDNLEGMKKLHRKYGRRVKWQGSWCRSLCEYHKRQESKHTYYY